MAQKFPESWKDTVVRWGYTMRDNVQGNWRERGRMKGGGGEWEGEEAGRRGR
jgi:hypothetical protein